ncbi:MAG: hypothetical protein JNM93_01930 [Bacteriovoracaceae bacterium]|nr:hypothetical protein [Bacteriovoracaceae bacterium]
MEQKLKLKNEIFETIKNLAEDNTLLVDEETSLIGEAGLLDSMKLVELCLTLEDRASDIGFEFDWTSDSAMSKSRGMFRTAGALCNEFISQMEAKT